MMEKRLRKGMFLIGTGILLAVIAGILGLLTYVAYDTVELSFVFSMSALGLSIVAFILKVIGLFMIFTRRKMLDKGRGLVTMGFISFITLLIVYIIGFIIEIIFIFAMDPRYLTISLILTELAATILGSLMILLPVYPLLSDKLKLRVVYSLLVIIILSLVVQPFVFIQMKEVEDKFEVDFAGQSYQGLSETLDEDQELGGNVTVWIGESHDIANLVVYNSITLIPYAYIGLQIFLYARTIKKKGELTRDFRHPNVEYPSGMHEKGKKNIIKKEEKCRYCGAELIRDLDFCPSCGAYLKE